MKKLDVNYCNQDMMGSKGTIPLSPCWRVRVYRVFHIQLIQYYRI